MEKNATLKDVAERAKVSYQTVSKVIRNQMQVTPEVRARIEQAIHDLGYHPNAAAQNLRTRSSHLIGYSWQPVGREIHSSPVLELFQHSIVESAEDHGYHILLFPQRAQGDLDSIYEELVQTRRVDGFILSGIQYSDPRAPIMQRLNVPVVTFGCSDDDMPAPCVDVDNRAGATAAVKHLIDLGHRKIAILAWPESSRVGTERLAGYWDAMEEAELPIDPKWIMRGRGEIEYGYDAAQKLFDLPETRRPTAIVTVLDTITIGVIQAAESCGLKVGRDLAVTGFDDMPVAQHLKPGLTTVRQPIWDVGRCVINLLIALLNGGTPDEQRIILLPELVIRESSIGNAQGISD
ncbi:MAG: LacI family DNA-binding transcriptional regulator [Anaerolineae bacterium]|nr:LacI family DNA-binding transcriptional regulator [Anaerolineae bacterium]